LKILALIPARSGSKSIKDKNIQSFHGKPLFGYSIEHGLQSSLINRVVVSTDSDYYIELSKSLGAEAPFVRPAEISGDLSTDLEAFHHALDYLKKVENYVPDICVHLRPTAPIRKVEDIDAMIQILIDNPEIDSVRSIVKVEKTPYKMWFKNEAGQLTPILNHPEYKEPYNMPRQALPQVYMQNACIDVIRTTTLTEKNSMTGDNISGYELSELIDIDTYDDFGAAALNKSFDQVTGKIFCFDIDGVIAKLSPGNDYNLSQPNEEMIKRVNQLYDNGNHIVLFTARGYVTKINWYDITKQQLISWGVKHHEFYVGKPNADYYVDDKNVLISQILN